MLSACSYRPVLPSTAKKGEHSRYLLYPVGSWLSRMQICCARSRMTSPIYHSTRSLKVSVRFFLFLDVSETYRTLQLFSVKHTISASLLTHPYHMKIIATKLTQKLANVLPETAEEAALAFEESMRIGTGTLYTLRIVSLEFSPNRETEWTSVKISPIMQQCISRFGFA